MRERIARLFCEFLHLQTIIKKPRNTRNRRDDNSPTPQRLPLPTALTDPVGKTADFADVADTQENYCPGGCLGGSFTARLHSSLAFLRFKRIAKFRPSILIRLIRAIRGQKRRDRGFRGYERELLSWRVFGLVHNSFPFELGIFEI